MYPLGTVLRLKTTGENVVIIGDGLESDDEVVVRRPINSESGIRHVKESFALYELDTVEESIRREYSDIKIRQNLMKGEEFKAELVQ